MAATDPKSASSIRVAVIDIGTNSTRLLIADVEGREVDEIYRESRVTRLGRGVDYSGQLSAEGIEAVCRAIADYMPLIEEEEAKEVMVIATSAVRDAENGGAFVAELRERFDLRCQVIDGDQEANFTYLGTSSGRDGEETMLVIDIGGGSTEMIIGRGPEPIFHTSLQAGVVRHTERILTGDPPGSAELESLARDIEKLVQASLEGVDLPPIQRAIAVAGTPSSLAAIDLELVPYDPKAVEGHRLPLRTVQWWLSRLASMPLAERQQVPGLHPDRAQAIVAGVVILIEIMRNFDLLEVEVSEHDILYGCAITAASGD
ncbi:MAG TPA: Ppx/GppA phosphatase family protein [Solirubrobacterales bacterium]|nr:Ppx/GppA phosphatase family protein [Solirubrobacterales bacterium]